MKRGAKKNSVSPRAKTRKKGAGKKWKEKEKLFVGHKEGVTGVRRKRKPPPGQKKEGNICKCESEARPQMHNPGKRRRVWGSTCQNWREEAVGQAGESEMGKKKAQTTHECPNRKKGKRGNKRTKLPR